MTEPCIAELFPCPACGLLWSIVLRRLQKRGTTGAGDIAVSGVNHFWLSVDAVGNLESHFYRAFRHSWWKIHSLAYFTHPLSHSFVCSFVCFPDSLSDSLYAFLSYYFLVWSFDRLVVLTCLIAGRWLATLHPSHVLFQVSKITL